MYGIFNTPTIATVFAGPKIAQDFHDHSTWRWAFGAFIIILVACSVPAMGVMLYMYHKARQSGYAEKKRSGRTTFESLKYYTIEFDSKLTTGNWQYRANIT